MSDSIARSRLLRGLSLAPIVLALAASPVAANGDHGGGTDLGLTIAVTDSRVDPRTGVAYVDIEVGCSVDLEHVDASASVVQPIGRRTSVAGSGSTQVDCSAETGASATITVFPVAFLTLGGKYGVGTAYVSVSASFFHCEPDEEFGEVCIDDSASLEAFVTKLHR